MTTEDPSKQIRETNLLDPLHSQISSSASLGVVEPTGTDSPSQNGAVEVYNGKLAIKTRILLYRPGLPPNTGRLPSYTGYTSITTLYTKQLNGHCLRASFNLNLTSAASKYLAFVYA
jgi:hypothetical protein